MIKGTLIPIGGNEDKGIEESEVHTLEFISDGILARVVRESGGVEARIVIIPTASSIPQEVGDNYLFAFNKLGCVNVEVVDIRVREESEEPSILRKIDEADCVMFSGGDQSKITKKIAGTTLHKVLVNKYHNEDFVIAGTSAGAMCMSKEMITRGSGTEVFSKGVVDMAEGMNFIGSIIFDSHFIRRGRFGRLAESVARFPDLIGIGLAEDTGLVIKNGNEFEVIGSGMIILFDGSSISHNNREHLEEGTPMTLTNLITHVLANGDRYNVSNKKIEVLPLEAPFV